MSYASFPSVDEVYGQQTLIAIANKYKFDLESTNFEWWIKQGARRWITSVSSKKTSQDKSEEKIRRSQARSGAIAVIDYLELLPEFHIFSISSDMESRHKSKNSLFLKDFEIEQMGTSIDFVVDSLKILVDIINEDEDDDENKNNTGGRPRKDGIIEFSYYIADFYERFIGERFSIDYEHGVGTTEAFDFLKDCAAPLAKVSDRELLTAARKAVSEMRSGKTPVDNSEVFASDFDRNTS